MEEGTLIFIGATTENPSFELNNALLSRARVYVLKPLQVEDLERVIDRALADPVRGPGEQELTLDPKQRRLLAEAVDGDARRALNLLELAVDLTDGSEIGADVVAELSRDRSGASARVAMSSMTRSLPWKTPVVPVPCGGPGTFAECPHPAHAEAGIEKLAHLWELDRIAGE